MPSPHRWRDLADCRPALVKKATPINGAEFKQATLVAEGFACTLQQSATVEDEEVASRRVSV